MNRRNFLFASSALGLVLATNFETVNKVWEDCIGTRRMLLSELQSRAVRVRDYRTGGGFVFHVGDIRLCLARDRFTSHGNIATYQTQGYTVRIYPHSILIWEGDRMLDRRKNPEIYSIEERRVNPMLYKLKTELSSQ